MPCLVFVSQALIAAQSHTIVFGSLQIILVQPRGAQVIPSGVQIMPTLVRFSAACCHDVPTLCCQLALLLAPTLHCQLEARRQVSMMHLHDACSLFSPAVSWLVVSDS